MDTFWQKLIEQLLFYFLPVILSLVVGLLYAWMRAKWAEFKQNKPDVAWVLQDAAKLAVKAAEQAGAAGYIKDKKNYALSSVAKYLELQGIHIDLNMIDAAIEAAVWDEINKDKQSEPKAGMGFTAQTGSTGQGVTYYPNMAGNNTSGPQG